MHLLSKQRLNDRAAICQCETTQISDIILMSKRTKANCGAIAGGTGGEMNQNVTLERLRQLVEGEAVAIRGRAVFEPAGAPADKVFPPSHSVGKESPGAKYAFETRRRGGRDVLCVLIDSVQSQANRMEEALQALWADKRITLPVIEVDLSEVAPDVGKVTSLTAPSGRRAVARQLY